jgi:hypothetical protein
MLLKVFIRGELASDYQVVNSGKVFKINEIGLLVLAKSSKERG